MGVIASLAALAVAAVAAAGVLRPFRRRGALALEHLSDPLEDQRRSLLWSLRELDEEHTAGAIPDEDYRALRHETEVRAVGVLHALAAREHGVPEPVDLRPLRPGGNGQPVSRTRTLPVLLVVAAVAAVSVPLLSSAVHDRSSGQSITGNETADPLSFFEQRVRQHPRDVAARLDLAARYRESRDLQEATREYLAALRLNPANAEANAAIGELLYRSGDARGGLRYVRRALATDAAYPEALFAEGLILGKGLGRAAGAAAALRAYLDAAPYGSHRTAALRLLRLLRRL
ncbi:MAG: tetratricopeptide repeat protein [Actinomycetota bacterium]